MPSARQEKPPFFWRKLDPSRMQSKALNNDLDGERFIKMKPEWESTSVNKIKQEPKRLQRCQCRMIPLSKIPPAHAFNSDNSKVTVKTLVDRENVSLLLFFSTQQIGNFLRLDWHTTTPGPSAVVWYGSWELFLNLCHIGVPKGKTVNLQQL